MSDKIVQLRQDRPVGNVGESLRRLADEIEKGEHGDHPVTTCVVLLGHTDSEYPVGEGDFAQPSYWQTRGYGARTDVFTVRGLMATCLRNWGHED